VELPNMSHLAWEQDVNANWVGSISDKPLKSWFDYPTSNFGSNNPTRRGDAEDRRARTPRMDRDSSPRENEVQETGKPDALDGGGTRQPKRSRNS
jgi:hypothetical protein